MYVAICVPPCERWSGLRANRCGPLDCRKPSHRKTAGRGWRIRALSRTASTVSSSRRSAGPRIHRGWELVPDFHLVAIWIPEEDIWLARHELAVLAHFATCGTNGCQGPFDVCGTFQPEAEVHHTAVLTSVPRLTLEDEHVPAARRLRLNEVALHVDGYDTDHCVVEAERLLRIAYGEGDMRGGLWGGETFWV